MDLSLTLAARALQGGDPLSALKRVSLRDDPSALALRGIAMAQLGELSRAQQLLRRARTAFGTSQPLAQARCLAAEAEVALASRSLHWQAAPLEQAVRTLRAHGDHDNAQHTLLIVARHKLLLGELSEAQQLLKRLSPRAAPALLAARAELVAFDIALRQGATRQARQALARAGQAARQAGIAALVGEVEQAERSLRAPVARLVSSTSTRPLDLDETQALLGSGQLVVDARRRCAQRATQLISLARRPVLFELLRALAEAFPDELARELLIARTFGVRRASPSLRARLRVELGRLRKELQPLAQLQATARGYRLAPIHEGSVLVLAPPVEGADAAMLALLADGAAWSSSALALCLGASQRTVQRALGVLELSGAVRSLGRGPARRFVLTPSSGASHAILLSAYSGIPGASP